MTGTQLRGLLVLLVLVTASAVGVVYTKYETRRLFVLQQQAINEREMVEIRWDRLRLELESWGNHARVSRLAREQLRRR